MTNHETAAPTETDRLHAEILEGRAQISELRDLLRSENQRANAAIDRETTAEQAAIEAQADLARLRAVVARLTQMTDHWERQLPEVIRTPAVVSAIRAALEPAVSVPPPAPRADNRAGLRQRIADELRAHASLGGVPPRYELPFFDGATPSLPRISGWRPLDDVADAVLAVLPEAADRAALDRVRALHQPIDGDGGPYCQTCTQDEEQPHPVGWWMPFPCPTVRVVDEELRRLADEAQSAVSGPCVAGGQQAPLCRCGHGKADHDAKYSDPQCRLCPEDGERSWRHAYTPAGEQQNETPEAEPLLCPRCGDDISDYGEDDFVFRTGDERPYCSGECIVAAHRAALSTAPAVVAQPGKETQA